MRAIQAPPQRIALATTTIAIPTWPSFQPCGPNMSRYKGRQKRESYRDMLTAHRLRNKRAQAQQTRRKGRLEGAVMSRYKGRQIFRTSILEGGDMPSAGSRRMSGSGCALPRSPVGAQQHRLRDFNADRFGDLEIDRKSTRLNSSHSAKSRMPSSA